MLSVRLGLHGCSSGRFPLRVCFSSRASVIGRRLPPGTFLAATATAPSVAGVAGEKKGDSGTIRASGTAGGGTRSGDGDRSAAAELSSGLVTGILSALTPRTLNVAACVLVWYGLSAMYSVYNAAVLRVFPFPLTVLTAELAAGVLLVIFAWVLGVIRTPSLRVSQMPIIFYVSLWHSVSNAATGAALRHSSLPAVTTIQGLEPVASAAVDRFMGRDPSHVSLNLCLLPVALGFLLVSREASLTTGGLVFAMVSSAAVGVRDLYSNRASRQKEFNKRPLSAANTYAVVTVMSFATVLPYTCIVDGPRAVRWWSSTVQGSAGAELAFEMEEAAVGGGEGGSDAGVGQPDALGGSTLLLYLTISGVLLFLHSAAAFFVLERMGSVTAFSVASSLKRGVVVIAAAVVMKAPLGTWTFVGGGLMISGACGYWVARMYYPPRRRRRGNLQQ